MEPGCGDPEGTPAAETSAAAVDAPAPTDGRRARRDRNADAVIDALLEFLAEGTLYPTMPEVAQRAGVSLRSVFRYFDDVDSLVVHALRRQRSRWSDVVRLPDPAPGTPLADRIEAMARHRADEYAVIGPLARAAWARRRTNPVLDAGIHRMQMTVHEEVRAHFAPELEATPEAERVVLHDALHAAIHFQNSEHLHVCLGLPLDRLVEAHRLVLRGLLHDFIAAQARRRDP